MRTSLGVVMCIVIELSCWPDTKSRVFQQPARPSSSLVRSARDREKDADLPRFAPSRLPMGLCSLVSLCLPRGVGRSDSLIVLLDRLRQEGGGDVALRGDLSHGLEIPEVHGDRVAGQDLRGLPQLGPLELALRVLSSISRLVDSS